MDTDVLDLNYSPGPFVRLHVDQYATMAPTHYDAVDGFIFPHMLQWVFATDIGFEREVKRIDLTATDSRATFGFPANRNSFLPGKYYWQIRTVEGADSVILLQGTMIVNPASKRQ